MICPALQPYDFPQSGIGYIRVTIGKIIFNCIECNKRVIDIVWMARISVSTFDVMSDCFGNRVVKIIE